jgi:hypothetical protein
VFAIDDLGGANIYPAIGSVLLAARAEGVGGVMTMVLRNFEDRVNELLGRARPGGLEDVGHAHPRSSAGQVGRRNQSPSRA